MKWGSPRRGVPVARGETPGGRTPARPCPAVPDPPCHPHRRRAGELLTPARGFTPGYRPAPPRGFNTLLRPLASPPGYAPPQPFGLKTLRRYFPSLISPGTFSTAPAGGSTPSAQASVGATISDDTRRSCLPTAGTPAPYTSTGTCVS
ncbi:MAG: hypothetical protein JWO38_2704 [Gemmataceae bacterium]|nr:hypothetical protein [Gemmataceae bacterium]